jgi:urease accessory protein UreE
VEGEPKHEVDYPEMVLRWDTVIRGLMEEVGVASLEELEQWAHSEYKRIHGRDL